MYYHYYEYPFYHHVQLHYEQEMKDKLIHFTMIWINGNL